MALALVLRRHLVPGGHQAMRLIRRSSPNFGPRRDGLTPELVVIHHTAMLTGEAAVGRLVDPAAEVSAHWVIGEDGTLWSLVDEAERAWHAGAGSWLGRGDVNSRSIGIELANAGPLTDFPPFPEPQMAALEALLDGILGRWGIGARGVIAHSDMAPERKADPGPAFDWRRLALGGRALWVEECAAQGGETAFAAAAERFGYPVTEAGMPAVLAAFRLRFRPWVTGPLAPVDVGTMQALADLIV
ncbi:N-acetylmuramoyl-L-alanine amidase [Amaricoccus macauensis]|uniref:N-acetylmuramoyl-L-alanine amidase n=2 Tax=Amaricoccus macauensis TaxID=57001 RepID=A0A840SPN0_9RHOB|nr:N-acetylmuramoyl-L-alanine amidase [Amaricoccus macauensis]